MTVNPLPPGPLVPVPSTTTTGAESLRPGQVIEARVAALLPGGVVRLDLGSSLLNVQSDRPLTPGATLHLQVLESLTGLKLALLDTAQRAQPTGARGATVTSQGQGTPPSPSAQAPTATTATATLASANGAALLPASRGNPPLSLTLTQSPSNAVLRDAGLFRTGEIIEGRVSQLLSGGRIGLQTTKLLPQQISQNVGQTGGQGTPQTVTLEAQATRPLELGTNLKFQILRGEGGVKLALINSGPNQPASEVASGARLISPGLAAKEVINQAVLQAAGEQNGLASFFATASQLVSEGRQSSQNIPDAVSKVLSQIFNLRVSPQKNFNGQTLRTAFQRSGIFLEQSLSGRQLSPSLPSQIGGDFKATLGRLTEVLQIWLRDQPVNSSSLLKDTAPPPPQRGSLPQAQSPSNPHFSAQLSLADIGRLLLSESRGALARIKLHQLASLPLEQSGQISRADLSSRDWSFEVPLIIGEETSIVQFRLSREDEQGTEASEHPWSVHFSLYLEELGPVHSWVRFGGKGIVVNLWAERKETYEVFKEFSDELGKALEEADLETVKINILRGAPKIPTINAGSIMDRST